MKARFSCRIQYDFFCAVDEFLTKRGLMEYVIVYLDS